MSREPDGTDDRAEITLLARQLAVELEAFAAEFAQMHGLHPTDVRALVHVMDAARHGQQLRPRDLSERLGLTTASVTALLDRLEREGHIERVRHVTDRRSITIQPKEQMLAAGGAYFGGLQGRMMQVLADLSDEQARVVRETLGRLIAVIEASSTDPPPGEG